MSAIKSMLASAALTALKVLFGAFSGPLKGEITDFVKRLYAKSLASDNPYDDFGVQVLAFLMSIDLTGVVAEAPAAGVEPKTMTAAVAKEVLSEDAKAVYDMVSTDSVKDGVVDPA
jgi:hypothetical protein